MRYLAVICVLAAAVSMASAATVTYDLDYDSVTGDFAVWATVSDGDNAGLAFFKVKFDGAEVNSLLNEAPTHQIWLDGNWGSMNTIGFTTMLEPKIPEAPNTLAGSQDIINNASFLVYYIGQSGGSPWTEPLADGYDYFAGGESVPTPPPMGTPFYLGSGNYTGATHPMDAVLEATANVFTDDTGYANFIPDVVVVPEPMTMTLLAIGGLALIRRRKA